MMYRVISTGALVPESETHPCGGCGGSGWTAGSGGLGYRKCQPCKGTGRLYGADPYVWPEAVEPVGEPVSCA